MTCTERTGDLVAWQLGELHGSEREALEEHVRGCTTCLHEFISLKRDLELAEDGPAPSPKSRLDLRDSVMKEFGFLPAPWWERPVAFFVGTASVVCAILVTTAV